MNAAKIQAIAEYLAASRLRFLTDVQIGAMRRKYGASRDEVRSAAIIADRIRRQRQVQEQHVGFSVAGLVETNEPIILKSESAKSRRPPA